MYEGGSALVIAGEMRRYNLAILGVSETHWTQSGETRLQSGETVIFSGHTEENAIHSEGVGFFLSKEASKALIQWEPVSSRIIVAKFRTQEKKINLVVIECYAPTNDAAEEQKDKFYDQLQAVMQGVSRKDIAIVMGDFNAKVGEANTGYESIMGKHGVGAMNENGEIFADFCLDNDIVIGGTVFAHRRKHKVTWVSPDHVTENQIDHICIARQFRRTLLDVRVKRGADAASDHHLLTAKLQMKLKRHSQEGGNPRIRYRINLLRDEQIAETFRILLTNKFQALSDLGRDQENNLDTYEQFWEKSKTAWNGACEEVLGRRKCQDKPWISENSIKKIEVRKKVKETVNRAKTRQQKQAAQQIYYEAHKEARTSIRNDKRACA
jgi:hypothetical protein